MGKAVTLKELLLAEKPEDLIASLSFENGLKLMDELVGKVESGTLALDQAIVSYERGVQLIEQLRTLLGAAEGKLKVLKKTTGKNNDE